jgi:hypothetical protein
LTEKQRGSGEGETGNFFFSPFSPSPTLLFPHLPYRYAFAMKLSHLLTSTFLLLTSLLFTACAPGTRTLTEITASPESQELERTAQLAYHKMEEARLETGSYNTNVLADLTLPQGVLWQLEALAEDSYRIRFVSSDVPGFAYIVTPEGVVLLPTG